MRLLNIFPAIFFLRVDNLGRPPTEQLRDVLVPEEVDILHVADGFKVPDVRVFVAEQVEELEGEGQEASAEQITECRQVGNGRVVRVDGALPHVVDQPVSSVQQDPG